VAVIPLAVAGVLLASGLFAWYYLRRSLGVRLPGIPPVFRTGSGDRDEALPVVEERGPAAGETMAGEPAPFSVPESLLSRYLGILRKEGLGAAAYAVYRHFSSAVARDMRIRKHTTLTPREISSSCRTRPYWTAFSAFVLVYERIRYGGYRSAAVQAEFETEMRATDSRLGGEDH
jgi:hypothetical protein